MARHLDIPRDEFVAKHVRRVDLGLSLRERPASRTRIPSPMGPKTMAKGTKTQFQGHGKAAMKTGQVMARATTTSAVRMAQDCIQFMESPLESL
jgi:hypothetical protein